MLQVGQIIELTHGQTQEKAPHVVQLVSEGSARAVPLKYKDLSLDAVPSSAIAIISINSAVPVYSDEEAASLVAVEEETKRGRKVGSKNRQKDEMSLLEEYKQKKRGRPKKDNPPPEKAKASGKKRGRPKGSKNKPK